MSTNGDSRRETILVTGAGGPAGVSVIQELTRLGYRTVGTDCDPLAAGLHLAQAASIVPRVDDESYLPSLLALAAAESVDAVISTMTEELLVLTRHEVELADAGLRFWFPPHEAVRICQDKLLFSEVVERARQPVPLTAGGTVDEALARVPGPWIVKPRFGRGSRDVHAPDSAADVRRAWSVVPQPILQTRLTGHEFTFDALTDRNGELIGGVPRFRLATKAGISTAGRTFDMPGLPELVASLLSAVGLAGPLNVQGFVDTAGKVAFTEINPRFSGALPLSLAAGSDLVGQYVDGVFGRELDPASLRYQPNVAMVRHWAETFYEQHSPVSPPAQPLFPDPTWREEKQGATDDPAVLTSQPV